MNEVPERCLDSTSFRQREGNKTRFWLWMAVAFCVARAAVAPWCRFSMPSAFDLTGPNDEIIVYSSALMLLCVGFAVALTRMVPVIACFVALLGYGAWLAYDLMHYAGFMGVGTIGKVLVGMVLIRALICSVMSRVL